VVIAYLDASAALKLLVEEAESDAFRAYWRETTAPANQPRISSGWLLYTELHCAARRRPEVIDTDLIAETFHSVTLVDIIRGDFIIAAQSRDKLRSADAIHLAVAQRIGADTMIGYDGALLSAAETAGMETVSPQ
jgi:predicted nucleic acid-binding protein